MYHFLSQEECSHPPENHIFGEIGLQMVWGIIVRNARSDTDSLVHEIFVKCREIPLLSRGADSQKSGKAIGEIAFGNAGKNSIANSSAAPTDFICCRRANFSWEPAEYFRRGELLKCFIFQNHELCITFFHKKNVPTPEKPHIWRDLLRNGLGKKRDT